MYMYGKLTQTKHINNKSGFTLIEVLVALAVFSVLSLTIFTSFRTYSATISQERRMAVESVRIQQTFREIEDYIRASTQNIAVNRTCLAANGILEIKDMDGGRIGNPPDKPGESQAQIRDRHDLTLILQNKELSIVKNGTPDGSGLRTVGKKIILSPNITSICITIESGKQDAAGNTTGNEKIKIAIKSGVDGLREVNKFIPYRGQFRNR